SRFESNDIIIISPDELSLYPAGPDVTSALSSNGRSQPDGRLITQQGGNGEISIVTDNGLRRAFTTQNVFINLGYTFCNVVRVPDYNAYPVGPDIADTGNQCLPPPAGLVSWWPGDGNTDDVVGGNIGTALGGVTFGAGEVGQAFNFNGIDG